jgi:UDP-glucuronate 4-epimerase
MRIVITGTAGFIGFHLARRLLADGHTVVGIDGITPYYDQALKRTRHQILATFPQFSAQEFMLEDADRLASTIDGTAAEIVIHLAAQAGVRYSNENPRAYLESNVVGTFNLLEALQATPCRHLLLASTSSVYGANAKQPFEESDGTDHPLSHYAATKKSTELLAHSRAHATGIPITAMRFFTVYGPWGRPDMALFKFTGNILAGRPIEVYGAGKMTRDFTYIDDVVETVCRLIPQPPGIGIDKSGRGPTSAQAPFRVVNIGNGTPVGLEAFIATIETVVGRKAIRRDVAMQVGDVPATWASTKLIEQITGFRPRTSVADGVHAFVSWYRDHYRV